MERIAAIWTDEHGLSVRCSDEAEATATFAALGGIRDLDGSTRFPIEVEEPVLAALDRLGFVWALGRRVVPRTWAERVFAEIPTDRHEPVFSALWSALDGLADHQALLAAAVPPGAGIATYVR